MPLLRWLFVLLLVALALMLTVPVLALAGSWLAWDAAAQDVLVQMARTVLPEYAWTTVILCVAVALGVASVGLVSATAVTLFDFPGRRWLEWALLLPLAMPAYVVAYAYTDFLQFSGPLQTWLRESFGLTGRVFPEVRNTAGAVWVFTFTLYPYVYLLARTALSERAAQLMEAARLLGAPLMRRIRQVALPLARPALAAGVALALMETLADFGVASYFGIQTFTAGIYKAWLAMDNAAAAAQLATMLLFTVGLLLWVERRSQQRLRFASLRRQRAGSQEAQPVRLHGGAAGLAWLLCVLPVLFGFVLPVLFMLRPLIGGWDELPWGMFVQWSRNSLWLAGLTAVLATSVALALGFALRTQPSPATRAVVQLTGLGYAVPGAVIVVGLLLPVAWLQQVWPASGVGYWITATALGIVWAYLVRFTSVALQSVQSGYARLPTSLDESARMLGTTGWGLASRVHAPLLRRGRGLVGVCGCDERTARHVGAAAVQQRHPGRGDLPTRARRALGRSRLARADLGLGGLGPGDSAQPNFALALIDLCAYNAHEGKSHAQP